MKISSILLDLINISKEEKDLLPEFLQYLGGPESGQAICGVSQVFLDMLDLSEFTDFPDEASKFKTLALNLVKRDEHFGDIPPRFQARRNVKASRALRNIITPCPAYSLFYYRTSKNPKALIRLQQALLVAMHNSKRTLSKIKNTDIANYGLAIRQLTEVKSGVMSFHP